MGLWMDVAIHIDWHSPEKTKVKPMCGAINSTIAASTIHEYNALPPIPTMTDTSRILDSHIKLNIITQIGDLTRRQASWAAKASA